MKKIFILLIICFSFISCMTMTPWRTVRGNVEDISYPKINDITESFLGDTLLVQGVHEKINIPVLKFLNSYGNISAGEYLGTQETGAFIKFVPDSNSGASYGLTYGAPIILVYKKETNTVNAARDYETQIEVLGPVDSKYYELTYRDVDLNTEDVFQQELIYLGKSGTTIKFAYREFKNDQVRPAFTTEPQYDLKDTNIIGYKKALIEVISATNTSIKYKVLRNFNDASEVSKLTSSNTKKENKTKNQNKNQTVNEDTNNNILGKWLFTVQAGGKAQFLKGNGYYHIALENGGSENYSVLQYQSIKLEPNSVYQLTFSVKTDTKRNIVVNINTDDPEYIRILQDQYIELTPDWKDYQFEFKTGDSVRSHYKFEILCGRNKHDVYIKDIVLQKK